MTLAIILDTETTGIDEPGLVEAAWIAVESPRDLSRTTGVFESRFNPGKPIEFGAMATHHIMNEDVANEPPAATFTMPAGTQYIIGHNVDFDWKVIGEPAVKRICTLAFCRKLWPDDSHTLGAMMYRLEGAAAREPLKAAHSALADAQMCRTVLRHILTKLIEPSTWLDVWQQCETARVTDVMAFGKHKGTPIKDVPADYKRWLLNQPDVDQYLRAALTGKRT